MKRLRYRKTAEKIGIKITVFSDGNFLWKAKQRFKGNPKMSASRFIEVLDEIKKEVNAGNGIGDYSKYEVEEKEVWDIDRY